jgi:hypothetical protein
LVTEKEYVLSIEQNGRPAPYVFFLEKYGVLIAQRERVNTTFFHIQSLDTQLELKWETRQDFPFFAYTNLQRYFDREHGYLYVLAQNIPPSKKAELLKIDLQNGSITQEACDLNVQCVVGDFKVVDENVFVQVLREGQLVVLQKPAGENEFKVVPVLFDNADRLQQMHEDFVSNAVYFFSYNNQKLENNVVPFSNLLGLQKSPKLFEYGQYAFANFQFKPFESKHKLMIGTFAKSINGVGLGVFSKVFDPNTNDPGKFRYFRFVEMPSIYAHLPEKRQAKIRAKFTRKADYGEEPKKIFKQMSFRTELYNFKPNEVVLAVEGTYGKTNNLINYVYNPTFKDYGADIPRYVYVKGGVTFDALGNPYPVAGQVVDANTQRRSNINDLSNFYKWYNKFDPFHNAWNSASSMGNSSTLASATAGSYNPVTQTYARNLGAKLYPRQVTLIGFDKEGKKLWDNHFIFKNFTPTPEYLTNPRLQMGAMGDSLVLAYFSQTGLTSKLIHQSNTIQPEVFQTYRSLFPNSFIIDKYYHFERLEKDLFVLQGEGTNPQNGEIIMFIRLLRYVPEASSGNNELPYR